MSVENKEENIEAPAERNVVWILMVNAKSEKFRRIANKISKAKKF